jgi:hypothetical protein
MKRYAIIVGTKVDSIVIADDPLPDGNVWVDLTGASKEPLPQWEYIDGAFVEHEPPIIEIPEIPNLISKAGFRFRMTDAEYAAILNIAKTDAEVQVWVETFNMVSQIDLDDPRTQGGVAVLVAKALLTQERATEILTAPVQPDERP